MVLRNQYLDRLIRLRDKKIIKVVTEVRRCGKSTLLKQFERYLLENGVVEEQIISINFEDISFDYLLEYHALHQYITERLPVDRKTYIFLDEIQAVSDFQKVVDSLFLKDNVDIYITGSNAHMLVNFICSCCKSRITNDGRNRHLIEGAGIHNIGYKKEELCLPPDKRKWVHTDQVPIIGERHILKVTVPFDDFAA